MTQTHKLAHNSYMFNHCWWIYNNLDHSFYWNLVHISVYSRSLKIKWKRNFLIKYVIIYSLIIIIAVIIIIAILQVEDCDFTSITNDKLKRHHTQLHSDKLFLCTNCGKSFSTSHNLRQHHLVKHPEADGKYYKCPKCPYKAVALQYVKRHMKIHSTVKKHK